MNCNRTIIINLDIVNLEDMKADDLGSWKSNGTHRSYFSLKDDERHVNSLNAFHLGILSLFVGTVCIAHIPSFVAALVKCILNLISCHHIHLHNTDCFTKVHFIGHVLHCIGHVLHCI